MKRISSIIFGWLFLLATAQAEIFDCTNLPNKVEKFVRCGNAIVQGDIPLDLKITLTKIYPHSKILSGDLDHDGINDFVVSITEQTSNGKLNRVVVLKGKPDGGYEDFAKSSYIEYGKADIEIRNQSFYIRVDHNSINQNYSEIYQFKYRNSGIFLIGEEVWSYYPVDENHGSGSKTSTNYLTGDVIETEKVNGKTTLETKSQLKEDERKLLRLEDSSR